MKGMCHASFSTIRKFLLTLPATARILTRYVIRRL
jgi:hypothetical protein